MKALLGRCQHHLCARLRIHQVDAARGDMGTFAFTVGGIGVAAVQQAMGSRDPRQPREVGRVVLGGGEASAQLLHRYQLPRVGAVSAHDPQRRLLVVFEPPHREEGAAQECHQASVVAQLDPGHVAGIEDGLTLAGGLVPDEEISVLDVGDDGWLTDGRTFQDDRRRIMSRLGRRCRRGRWRGRWRRGRG